VRAATVDDADAMGEFHVRAWQDAYRGLMPDDFLDALDPAPRTAGWREAIVTPVPHLGVLVADDGAGGIVGLVTYARARDADGEGTGEIFAIYAAAEHWGRGVGPALHDAAIAGLTAEGFTEAVLWVLATNARAIRFYERNGWRPDGAAKTDTMGSLSIDEVRYRRPL